MVKLQYHRTQIIAAAHPNNIIIDNLGHCLLRVINLINGTDRCLGTVGIMKKGDAATSIETISLMHHLDMDADADLSWQGAIELMPDQVLKITFEDSPGVAPTAGDAMAVTVGYEFL